MPFLAPVAGWLVSSALTGATIGGITISATAATLVGGAVSLGLSAFAASKVRKPSQDRAYATERLQLGEGAEEVIVGAGKTGGRLAFVFNDDYGNTDPDTDNEWETMIIRFSAVRSGPVVGFQIGEDTFAFSSDGVQIGPWTETNGDECLYIWYRDGSPGQTPPAEIIAASGGKWTANHTMTGCAHLYVRYRTSPDIWKNGRPEFKWYMGGAYMYDPRLDSTVSGGSGACRWDDPSTYVLSDNPIIQALNFKLGFWNNGQLMVGMGLSMRQALGVGDDPHIARVFAAANACEEEVAWKVPAGPEVGAAYKWRYSSRRLIQSTENFDEVLQDFADATGGYIGNREGRMEIIPGIAQTPMATITDDDLIVGETIEFSKYLSATERLNSVTHQFLDAFNYWNLASTPMRRDNDDVIADGRPFATLIPFGAVTEQHQAQRIAEIRRREARLERSIVQTIPARYVNLYVGAWVWRQSAKFDGDTIAMRVDRIERNLDRTLRVTLREISAEVYAWDPEVDELTYGARPPPSFWLMTDGSFWTWTDGGKLELQAA